MLVNCWKQMPSLLSAVGRGLLSELRATRIFSCNGDRCLLHRHRAVRRSWSSTSVFTSAGPGRADWMPASASTASAPRGQVRKRQHARMDRQVKETDEVPSGDLRNLPVSGPFKTRLRRLGVRSLTEIQTRTFAPILEGRNVVGVSRNGSGKTIAFLLPLLERMSQEKWTAAQPVVVVEPTRDLAEQVFLVANRLREHATKVVLLYGGGGPQVAEAQRAALKRGAHLVIGTPGRVKEVFEEGLLRADRVPALVLDEVDVLLKQGLGQQIRPILEGHAGDYSMQTLLFAGSFPHWLRDDVAQLTREPVVVDLLGGRSPMPPEVKHLCCEVTGGATRKARLVAWLLEERLVPQMASHVAPEPATKATKPVADGCEDGVSTSSGQAARALIFASTRAEVSLLSTHAMLRQRVVSLHAQMAQHERAEALEIFRASEGYALVTTDLAARGLEIPPVPLVIHSQPPANFEAYSNRVSHISWTEANGRRPPRWSASRRRRASAESIVICKGPHVHQLRDFERELGFQFEHQAPPSDELLRSAAVSYISRELTAAKSQYDAEAFVDDAEQQLELHGPRLLAAALVLLERRRKGEDWASPLSGRARYTPVLFADPYMEQLRSRQAVLSAIGRALRGTDVDDVAGEGGRRRQDALKARVGRVELTRNGYLADVPHEDIPKLIADPWLRDRGVSVMPVARIPELLEDTGPDDARLKAARRRQRRQAGRARSSQPSKRVERRLQFLYPAGRRVLGGEWMSAGLRDVRAKPEADAKT